MKALRWYARGDVRYEDVPEPTPGPGQVKAKIHYTGICGSDLHEYEAGPIFIPLKPHPLTGAMPPIILGHEFTGRVVELGAGVMDLKIGDRVTGDCLWTCGKCYYCLRGRPNLCVSAAATGFHADGTMAEYLVAPAYTFYRLPELVSDELGALAEPLAVAFHAVRQSRLQVGNSVAIMGAGPIGCAVVLAAKAAGASQIYVSEFSKGRREMGLGIGATAVIDPSENDPVKVIQDFTKGLGADIVFDCVGSGDSPPVSVRCARTAGTVVILGISAEMTSIRFNDVVMEERTIIGSIAYAYEIPSVLQMMSNGAIESSKLITGRIKLGEVVEKGFRELIKNKDAHLKILVESPGWS